MCQRFIRFTAIAFILAAPGVVRGAAYAAECPADWAGIQPSRPGYAKAVDLNRRLTGAGVRVMCIVGSKMSGMFEGQEDAVLFRTDRGDFEALTMPQSRSFDALTITERRDGGRYVYSFAGQPKAVSDINSPRPIFFSRQSNRLLVTSDQSLLDRLTSLLARR